MVDVPGHFVTRTNRHRSSTRELVSVLPVSFRDGMNIHRRCLDSLSAASLLLRKEVIQPHLPVRLPCYDFVLIADPTFDGSLPCGLGHRLRVLPTFMT